VGFYKESKKRFDADADFKARAQREVVRLQGGDEDSLKAWRLICEVSRVEFEKIYKRLGVTLLERGESFYNPFLPGIVEELLDTEKAAASDGAIIMTPGESRPVVDLTTVDIERVLQATVLQSTLQEVTPLVAYLTSKGLVGPGPDGALSLNVGTAKAPQWIPLAAVGPDAGPDIIAKVAKTIAQSGVQSAKGKQGSTITLDPAFVNTLRQIPGLVKDADGVESVFVPMYTYPFMLRKSDGGYTYDTTDLAALRYRLHEEEAQSVIYVTDIGQEPHFAMLFAAARSAGFFDPATRRCDHVGFGLVFGPDGKKLKTREGDTIRLADLLDEAPRRAYEESVRREQERATVARERGETYEALSEEELRHNSEVIGYGAVKYFDLRQNRTSSYRFSYDEMLSLKGNTAVHLIYAYVRMRSIARKAGLADTDDVLVAVERRHPEGIIMELRGEAEWALGLHLMRFPTTVEQLTEELQPNKMTDFLYQLVTKFNDFYQKENVLKAEDRDAKLLLCEATATTLRTGLRLLGIDVLEKL